jgi:hypothetical protein
LPFAVLCCGAFLASAPPVVGASPQDSAGNPATSLTRVKARLDEPIVRPLTPSVPVQLHPVFKSGVEKHPFVLTLDQDLHQTFDLTALQRQSAAWSSQCCGLDLVRLYKVIQQANKDRLVSKTRAQIARELSELQAARAAAGADR